MTATIDKRVVEMAFDNNQFESNVGRSLSTIDKLKRSLNFEGAGKGLENINTAANGVNLNHISSAVDEVKNRFSILGIIGFTAIQNITNGAIDLAKRLTSAFLGIDSIKSGFGSYETKIEAIRTVMSGTGETIDQVTQSINDLNKYSDRTIFSFQDMTSNISKFTNAGLSSKEAAIAIQGISNVAAESGANANEAARAMYNFGQALSQGSIRLMDWKSIENANMATIEFKNELLKAAAAEGTLKDNLDGTFTTMKGTVISATKHFNDTLEEQWLTAKVLTNTLSDYASQETEIGKKANAAATQVKTFSQLMDTFADSLKTGWTKSFEIVIGNLDQATSFFSTMNDFLGNTAGAAAKARNELLQGWNDLGGRTELIKAFQNALNSIVTVINPIAAAFKSIFPPTTAKQLFDLTKSISTFTEKLIISSETADKVKRIFTGIFAVADIVKMAVVSLITNLGKLIGSFSKTGKSIFDATASFGDWLVNLRDAIKQSDTFNTVFSNIFKVVRSLIVGVGGFFAALIGGFKNTDKVTKSASLSNFLTELGEKFKAFGKLGIVISKVFGLFAKIVEKIGPIVGKVVSKLGDLFNSLLDAMTRGLDKLDAGKFLDLFSKGFLGGAILALKGAITDSKKLVGEGLFAGLLLSLKNFVDNGGGILKSASGILDGVKTSLEAYQKSLKANSLLKIAAAIGILALSIIALSFIDPEKLLHATAAISAMFFGLMSTLDIFDKTVSGNKQMIVMTGALLGISAAVLILTTSLVILSKLKPEAAAQGVLAIGAVLGTLLLFQKVAGSGVGFVGVTAGLISLSIAMLAVGVAIRNLGKIKPDVLAQGLVAMGVSLGIIAIALNSMNAAFMGAAALTVASAGILVLSFALKALATLSLEQLGVALLALAGTFVVLGVAGALMTPVAPTLAIVALSLLAIGAAAAAFGVGIAAVGTGLASLAVGIVTLAGLSSAGIAAISLVITGLAALLPLLAIQIAKGLTSFIVEIAKSAPKIAMAMANLGLEMLKGFATTIPTAVDTVLKFMIKLMDSIATQIPKFVSLGFKLLIGFLSGMRNNIGQVVTLSIDIINTYLKSVASRIPEMVDSGFTLLISWIDGMKQGVDEHLPELMDSVSELGWAIINGLLKGLIEGQKNVKDGIINLANTIINAFKEFMGIHSPSSVFQQLAAYLIEGLKMGIILNAMKVISEIKTLATQVVDAVKGKYSTMVDAGKNLVIGFANGIKSLISTALDAAGSLAKQVLDRIRSTLGIHSPSDETTDDGMNLVKGLANGITKFAGIVVQATDALADKTLTGFNSIIAKVSDTINTNMDFSPSIRPVVDMSDVRSSSSKIDDIFGNKSFGLSMAASTAARISASVTPSIAPEDSTRTTPSSNINFTQINNSPKELSRFEIYRQTKNQLLQTKGLIGVS